MKSVEKARKAGFSYEEEGLFIVYMIISARNTFFVVSVALTGRLCVKNQPECSRKVGRGAV
jgi:hypothetical protein